MERRPAISAHTERALLMRQRWKCKVCGTSVGALYDVDHVIPRCILPRDDVDVLQVLCVPCHARKTRIDEPRLITAHKRADTRVCWMGCRRVVRTSMYCEEALACVTCVASGEAKRVPLVPNVDECPGKREFGDEREDDPRLRTFEYAPTVRVGRAPPPTMHTTHPVLAPRPVLASASALYSKYFQK